MSDVIQIRQQLRKSVLNELYDYHFENNGAYKDVAQEISSHETNLAYEYLSGKGYIIFKAANKTIANAKITSQGIDIIESGYPLSYSLNEAIDQLARDIVNTRSYR
ncbi:hypothetical protein [Fictibacillus phosphorivorans]|uniref:hypothetical protein n=1 Tax=Fictibacillus phosphorivorans TaxID=1221500 RepID=UPI00119EBEC3|nr:hypothetical protein [Fictibacillus phosphorivorans]